MDCSFLLQRIVLTQRWNLSSCISCIGRWSLLILNTFLRKCLSTLPICKLSPLRLGEIGSPLLQWSLQNCFQISPCGIVSIEMVRTKNSQLHWGVCFLFFSSLSFFPSFHCFPIIWKSEEPWRGSC